ncbi:hypothetical protein RclHR1_03180002 [Rhizophagus clarus]|uniref:Sacsin-like isoform X1 n=1 Tax=Rhizophagus clarus TaxID=94130 RepID=A0A2Z6R7A7_9GLOM|nr:hypothetical protein RclHR1_03180002 [Rhizophagus clarus]GET00433.1 sacsin-like isoform X1 [Rhizophagus clarus]
MSFQSYGQNETLVSSIRNIIKDYPVESIFKEFLQNADDAGATQFHIIVDGRTHPTSSLINKKMKDWQGPAVLMFNNAKFKEPDFDSLMQIRVGGKQGDTTKIGKHGLGFNSCYHLTDVPSFVSGDKIAFLDPQEKFLSQRGIIGSIPQNGSHKDQLAPFKGIKDIDFRKGTLFRIPLRKEPSELSDTIFTIDQILELVKGIKSNFSNQFLFLRNIETIEISYLPCYPTGIFPQLQSLQMQSLWKATITGLDENVRRKRKCVENGATQIFQINIEIDNKGGHWVNMNKKQNDHWIIITGSQRNPDNPRLNKYVRQHRLCVSGGIAALLKSSAQSNFAGKMYSFLSLSDVTNLPVHLNGVWAQGSDRGKLLIESDDDSPDLDHLKLDWNRHILLDFLPKLYCKLLKEVIELRESNEIELNEHPVLKFWPFPPITKNYPKYIIEYGCKVLQQILQNEDNFQSINGDSFTDRMNNLFNLITREKTLELRDLLRNNWDEIKGQLCSEPDLKLLVRSLPIWPVISDPLRQDLEPPLKPASCGYILPKNTKHYRTKKNARIYLDAKEDLTRKILTGLDVQTQDVHEYTFEDVEFPNKSDYYYLDFLKDILDNYRIVQGLRDKRCFPSFTGKTKKIADLYDHENIVFRTVFSGIPDMFLDHTISECTRGSRTLSNIGFKDNINQDTFIKCVAKIEELQKKLNSPPDIRYRGFILVDHLYNNINDDAFKNLESSIITRIPFVPISKNLDKPYSLNYSRSQILDCFNNVILPDYKEVAWSQMSLIAEDVVPPLRVLNKYPSLGKPKTLNVIEHLRFLYETLRNNDEWKKDWTEIFKHNVYEVYNWLEKECSNDEDLNLTEYIHSYDPLFLNFNKDYDPFKSENWVSVRELVLNSEPSEEKYVNPSLAKYSTMLKRAGAREVKRPNIEIRVRIHDQSATNKIKSLNSLFDPRFSLNDATFIVNGERIMASRYMLAISSSIIINDTEHIEYVEPNSVRVLLRYLYGQNIDDAIKYYRDISPNINYTRVRESYIYDEDEYPVCDDDEFENHREDARDIFERYKDLLKLANNYRLDHLKELMEVRLSRSVTRLNVVQIKNFAETHNANQLKDYCNQFVLENNEL